MSARGASQLLDVLLAGELVGTLERWHEPAIDEVVTLAERRAAQL